MFENGQSQMLVSVQLSHWLAIPTKTISTELLFLTMLESFPDLHQRCRLLDF